MISSSVDRQALADSVGLRTNARGGPSRLSKVGFAIAEELAAEAVGDSTMQEVIRRETRSRIETAIHDAPAEYRSSLQDLLDEFESGKRSDDDVDELLKEIESQISDDRCSRAPPERL